MTNGRTDGLCTDCGIHQKCRCEDEQASSGKSDLLFSPWDTVKLEGRTGRYRVYSWGKSDYIFACLDADVVTTSGKDTVSEILERAK